MPKNEFICDCNVIHEETVNSILEDMLSENFFQELTCFFKAMGDKTRAKILYSLEKNELCVCDIANILGMSKSSISHQLATLKENGLVKYRKIGKEVYYSLDDDHVKLLLELGVDHVEHKLKNEN